jgi:hypothetical protein
MGKVSRRNSMSRGKFAQLALLAVAGWTSAAEASVDFVAVSPIVTSSVQTRFQTYTFDSINAVEYRAGSPVDGGGFEATVLELPDSILFKNGGVALGAQGIVASSTELLITLTNASAAPIVFSSFESVIIPAGFGLYTTNVGGACGPLSPTACSHTDVPGSSFQNVARDGILPPSPLLGRAGFDFQVQVDGVEKYALASSVSLLDDGMANILIADLGLSETTLSNWRVTNTVGEIGYAWDTTRFTVDLGNRVLLPGESQTVRYISTVFAETYAVAGNSSLALLGYSAFGDPPTRPGGGGSRERSAFLTALPLSTDPSVTGLNIGFFEFNFPTYDPLTGGLTYPPVNPIPEPATWAMLIAGFGLVGSGLRRRRSAIA